MRIATRACARFSCCSARRAAPAVELAALDHRRPRSEAVAPPGHLGLLVEMAVNKHIGARSSVPVRWDVYEEHWSAIREAHDLELHARHRVPLAPFGGEPHCRIDVAVARPFVVEMRRLGGNADVVDEGRNDGVVPEFRDGSHWFLF